jgi:hypothetical protein
MGAGEGGKGGTMTYIELLEECDKRALVIANYQRVISKQLDNIAKLINIVEIMSERQLGEYDVDDELVKALRASIQEQKTMVSELREETIKGE